MQILPAPVMDLIDQFAKLPGIGPRSAERLTFYLLRTSPERASQLGQALLGLHGQIRSCERCSNLSTAELCPVCSDDRRDATVIAVVEEPLDVVALEKTGLFSGLYHVLGGVISPLDGIGPEQLTIKSLLKRLDNDGITEVILATNANTEGETTAMYIRKQLDSRPIKITRLARGLPVGSDLEYADQITLGRALQGRQAF